MGLFFAFFWLYAAYHLVVLGFNRLIGSREKLARRYVIDLAEDVPAVAILYPTMNDFDEVAVRSCLEQDYANFRVFILDDSTDAGIRAEVDRFASVHIEKLTVVRRVQAQRGFKAGNLNHALAGAARDYPLFAVLDADCVLPADFTRLLVPQLLQDHRVAFVQSACRARTDQTRFLAKVMAPSVDVLWRNYMSYRNDFGFIPLMGHGALIRRDAWETVGGFPEVIAEDIAFALCVREQGLHGKYASEPFCHEALPPEYRSFCGQQAKYSRGACQLLFLYWRQLLFSTKLRWFEKVDLGLFLMGNVLPSVLFLFMILVALIIPAVYYDFRIAHLGESSLSFWIVFTPGAELSPILTRDFYALSVVCILTPLLATFGIKGMRWRERIRFVSWSTSLHLAMLPQSLVETIRFVITRKTSFFVTGNRSPQGAEERISGNRAVTRLDLASGFAFIACSAVTLNLYLTAVGVAILIGVVMKRSIWAHNHPRHLGLMARLPLLLMFFAVSLLGFGLLSAQGALFAVVPVHF
jgi:cellulose synthase/poly-beta-1,6-N-acetylglucosamine synthase-like glycosyltransferase